MPSIIIILLLQELQYFFHDSCIHVCVCVWIFLQYCSLHRTIATVQICHYTKIVFTYSNIFIIYKTGRITRNVPIVGLLYTFTLYRRNIPYVVVLFFKTQKSAAGHDEHGRYLVQNIYLCTTLL